LAKKSYNVYSEINQVVNKLNTHPQSNIRGLIATDRRAVFEETAIVMFDVLFDSIELLFNIKDNHDVSKYSNYLRSGLNLITDENPNLLKNHIDDRIMAAYLTALERYHNQQDWENKLLNVISKINLEEIQEIPYKKIDKKFINNIIKYIESKEVLYNV